MHLRSSQKLAWTVRIGLSLWIATVMATYLLMNLPLDRVPTPGWSDARVQIQLAQDWMRQFFSDRAAPY